MWAKNLQLLGLKQEDFHYTRHHRDNSWVKGKPLLLLLHFSCSSFFAFLPDGSLHLQLSLTADTYGEEFLESGELDLTEEDPDHPCNEK